MIILALGANGSGKSLYAEKLISRLKVSPLYYIATMIPFGEEGLQRVEKHRKQRESLGFITVEKQSKVSEISFPANSAVLLEDVSNLLVNSMFGKEDGTSAETVFEDIAMMSAKCQHTILVSIDGLTPMTEFDAETNGYIGALNELNKKLWSYSNVVIKMRNGEAFCLKGDLDALY